MTTPVYLPPVLLQATVELYQSSISGRLPNIAPGQLFWASGKDAVNLLANGNAVAAPANSVLPPEPSHMVNQTAGVGAGTSNSSH